MPITTTPNGGPQGEFSTYTPIYSQTITSNTTSVTFSNIPSTFTDLVLKISVISTSTNNNYINLQYNGDTSSNYSTTILSGDGTSALSARFSDRTDFNIDYFAAPHTQIGTRSVQIMNYSNNTTLKTGLVRSDRAGRGTDAMVGLWRSTAPITSIKITHDTAQFAAGSNITLYGIKAAASQFIPTKASGGDIVVSDGTYAYHAFLSTGSFKPAQSLTADILVVAGGGGSGYWNSGGGGAGGLVAYTSQSLTAINYAITVGAGGAGSGSGAGGFGGDSQFGVLTASKGGGGGAADSTSAANGGGSGGGAGFGGTGGNATSGQGNVGGNGDNAGPVYGGGGGGAGGAGTAGTVDGAGGIGLTSSLTNAMGAATSTGQLSSGNYYYAGGGAGGNQAGTTFIAGGLGGGGRSGTGYNATVIQPVPGTPNTGGGAGGSTAVNPGTTGGSGIVIVRYTL
jgi:hypothetical protein